MFRVALESSGKLQICDLPQLLENTLPGSSQAAAPINQSGSKYWLYFFFFKTTTGSVFSGLNRCFKLNGFDRSKVDILILTKVQRRVPFQPLQNKSGSNNNLNKRLNTRFFYFDGWHPFSVQTVWYNWWYMILRMLSYVLQKLNYLQYYWWFTITVVKIPLLCVAETKQTRKHY